MSRNLPLLSKTELQKHVREEDAWVTLFDRKIYNITEFIDEHPGGGDILLPYLGQDVTEIMADSISHEHSESAYEMLDDEMLVGYLANAEEEEELLNNKNKTPVEVKLSDESEYHLDEFHDKLPELETLSIQTDYTADLKKHKFLDLSKPLFLSC